MYKLMMQVQYDEYGRHLVEAVYTDHPQHPRKPETEGVYDMDTNIKWWQCSTDELLCDDREYKNFILCQDGFEIQDGSNKRLVFTPNKRNIVFNKKGEVVLLCNDTEWYRIIKEFGSIENYLKIRQTELEF